MNIEITETRITDVVGQANTYKPGVAIARKTGDGAKCEECNGRGEAWSIRTGLQPCPECGGSGIVQIVEFFWGVSDANGDDWHPIPRYLYDAIMRHHREAGL